MRVLTALCAICFAESRLIDIRALYPLLVHLFESAHVNICNGPLAPYVLSVGVVQDKKYLFLLRGLDVKLEKPYFLQGCADNALQ